MASRGWIAGQISCLRTKGPRRAGGVRKIRFVGKQRGKRGGTRIIYVHLKDRNAIALFMAYGKNVKDNLNAEDKKVLKELIAEIKKVIPLKGKRNEKRK